MSAHPYTCPCCGYQLQYSDEIAQAIAEVVSECYGVSMHKLIWDKYSARAGRARSALVYCLRRFTAATFSEMTAFLGFPKPTTRPGAIYARFLERLEVDEACAVMLEGTMEAVAARLQNDFYKKISDALQ